jgi:SAM-dependent methyltransferase
VPEQYPLQLYDALCAHSIAEHHTIADVSCGRGGGIAYLHRRYRPRRAIGIDLVEANIEACRAEFRQAGLTFSRASAEALPFTDGELDVVITVEASHCYGSLERFLAEAHRALVPGGELLWTDFAPATELENRRAMVRRHFEVVEERDITSNVLLAMRLDAARRESLIRTSASRLFHRVLLHFAAAGEDQRTYRDFAEGRDRYFLFRLQKPR